MIAVESRVTETPLGWWMPSPDMLGSRAVPQVSNIKSWWWWMNWQSRWPYFEGDDDGFNCNYIYSRNDRIKGSLQQSLKHLLSTLSPPRTKFIVSKTHPIFIQKLSLWTPSDFECISNSVLNGILQRWQMKNSKMHDVLFGLTNLDTHLHDLFSYIGTILRWICVRCKAPPCIFNYSFCTNRGIHSLILTNWGR